MKFQEWSDNKCTDQSIRFWVALAKVTGSQKVKIVLQIAPFKIVFESRDKNYNVAYSVL